MSNAGFHKEKKGAFNRFPLVLEHPRRFFELSKTPLSLLIAMTAVTGYLIARPPDIPQIIFLFSGVFFLSAGAATLNNFQDRRFDRQFRRTQHRAIPRGKVTHFEVLTQVGVLMGLGFGVLMWRAASYESAIIGLLAVLLYNVVYTPLKKRTWVAIIPGAICGMLPPYIGWTFAGATGVSYLLALVMVSIGVWQLPHYWLLILRSRKDFTAAFSPPNLLVHISETALARITFIWILAYGCLCFLTLVVQPLNWVSITMAGNVMALLIHGAMSLRGRRCQKRLKRLGIHLSVSLFMLILVIDVSQFIYLSFEYPNPSG